MFSAKDSLYNVRTACKRESSTSLLPMEELRGLAKKRQRTDTGVINANQAQQLEQGSKEVKKSVSFDFSRNTHQESLLSADELGQGWLSSAEFTQIKTELRVTVLALQQGLLNPQDVCIRGIESHIDPSLASAKLAKSRAFISRILQQQCLLKAMMGKVNDHILGKLSSILSGDDTRQASHYAIHDAHVASLIHSSDNAKASNERLETPSFSVMTLLREALGQSQLHKAAGTSQTATNMLGVSSGGPVAS